MKNKISIPVILVSLLIVTLIVSGCSHNSSPFNSAESSFKFVLDNLVKEDYDNAFSGIVDMRGKPLSEATKQQMQTNAKTAKTAAYEIKEVADHDLNGASLPQAVKDAGFEELKVVSYTATFEGVGSENEEIVVGKINGEWKVVLAT